MKKIIGFSLIALISFLLFAGFFAIRKFNNTWFSEKPNYMAFTSESKPIQFDWSGDSIGGIYEPQAAMVIPVQIKGLAQEFYMQFDTGAPQTTFYGRQLHSLREMGIDINEVVNDKVGYVESLDFILGDNHVNTSMIKVYPNYGYSFGKKDTLDRIGIGTIGSDFLDDRITIIDFQEQTIQFYDERPEWMQSLQGFQSFDFTGRRVMLPVRVDNRNYEFLYDSGCSAFGLITTKGRFDKYSEESSPQINYDAKSWESSIPIRSKISEKQFSIGNATLALQRVSYVDMYKIMQPLIIPFTRIGGWMGNQVFIESTLILDTKAEEFLVIMD